MSLTQSTTPRAWTVPKGVPFGDLTRMVLLPQGDIDIHIPSKDGNVKVATKAVGLNFADIFTLLGYYSAANAVRSPQNQPFVPGLEFAGVVLEDSSGTYHNGDRVYGFTRFGAYADIVHVPPANIRKLPSNWSFEQGAAFLVNALTAWHGLVTVAGMPDCHSATGTHEQDPFVVVVHSAAGGVGLWVSEIAARRGAIVVGIVGHVRKIAVFRNRVLRHCPAAQCVVRANSASQFEQDLRQAIVEARTKATNKHAPAYRSSQDLVECGWGADVIMECYGGKYFMPTLNLLNAGGSLATYGSTTYNGSGGNRLPFLPLALQYLQRPRIDPGEMTGRNIRVGGFNLIFLTERTEALSRAFTQCIGCLSGTEEASDDALALVTPPEIGDKFDFETQTIEALRALRSGTTVGKVVLVNDRNPVLHTSLVD